MGTFILYARLALQILPLLPAAIREAEDLFGPGNGTQKRAFVLMAISESLDLANMTGPKAAEILQLTARLLTSAVSMMHATGLLPKPKPSLIAEG